MIRPRLAVLVLGFACGLAAAGEVLRDSLPSAALKGELRFSVYLPDGYRTGTERHPVLYLLHAAEGNETEWTRSGGAAEMLDSLIASGWIRPYVVVMPSAGPRSWWIDGAAVKAETALVQELIPYVEGKYRVATERSARAVAGASMGGFGSLNLALRYPDRFCGAALFSPAAYATVPPDNSAARSAEQFQRDRRFDEELFKSLNYTAHLEAYAKAPRKVTMLIFTGDADNLGIAIHAEALLRKLKAIEPREAELRVLKGGHDWDVFRRSFRDGLPYIDKYCVAEAKR